MIATGTAGSGIHVPRFGRAAEFSFHVKACYVFLVPTRNITIAFPEDLFRRVELMAAKRDSSVSALLTATLSELADQEEGYAEARDGMLADLARGYDLGTRGVITWTRDALHER